MPTIEVHARSLRGPGLRFVLSLLSIRPVRWALILVGVLAVVAWPEVVCVAVVATALWWSRRWWRGRLARQYLLPVSETIASPLAARFRLMVSAEHVRPHRTVQPLSPVEERVRAWYGTRVEPIVRWLPDRVARVRTAVGRWLAPVARVVDQLRRPRPEPPVIRLDVWRPYLTPEQQGFVESVIRTKIPLPDCSVTWRQIGSRVTATWTVRKPPPRRAGCQDLLAVWDRLTDTDLYVGESSSGPVVVSLHDDSPHIAVSAGSGAGKSVLAQLLATQVLARGGEVVILDRKGSHRWAVGLPRVTYARRPAEMHAVLVRLAEIADERNQRSLSEPESWDPGPRILVILEELNATIGQLVDHWGDVRQSGDPRTSPAIRALREILYMGRSAKVNVVAIAQMLTARAIGGPEARENFSVRCLARYTSNAWRMLAPHVPMPRSTRQLGRWQIVTGGTSTETQVAYLTDAESRVFAARGGGDAASLLSGAAAVPIRDARSDRPSTRDVPGDIPMAGDSRGQLDGLTDPLSEPLTLREAVGQGVVPWSYDATKKRLQRSPTRPGAIGRRGLAVLYRRGDLIEWVERETSRST